MRYFYTDALAAAWQAKHFGMRFAVNPQVISQHFDLVDIDAMDEDFSVAATNGDEWLFYIHPDNLHLLQPRVGDLVYACPEDIGEGTFWRYELWNSDHVACSEYWSIGKIVQRNGKPFMMPESEAA